MHEILLRLASAQEPILASDLWRQASREANQMTPFAIAAMWELVDDGLLDYDSSAIVTVVNRRGTDSGSKPLGGDPRD